MRRFYDPSAPQSNKMQSAGLYWTTRRAFRRSKSSQKAHRDSAHVPQQRISAAPESLIVHYRKITSDPQSWLASRGNVSKPQNTPHPGQREGTKRGPPNWRDQQACVPFCVPRFAPSAARECQHGIGAKRKPTDLAGFSG